MNRFAVLRCGYRSTTRHLFAARGGTKYATGNHRVEGRNHGSDAIYRRDEGNPEGRASGPGGSGHTHGGTVAVKIRRHPFQYDEDRLSSQMRAFYCIIFCHNNLSQIGRLPDESDKTYARYEVKI